MQLDVLGLIHYTHSTGTELLQNAVMGNGVADHVDANPTLGTECYSMPQGESNRHRQVGVGGTV